MNATWKKLMVIAGMTVLVSLSTYSIVEAQLRLPKATPKTEQPKEHLKLVLKPLRDEFVLGQPIDLKLRIRNVIKEPLKIVRPSVEYDLKGWVLSGEITAPDGSKRVVTSARRTAKLPDPASGEILLLKPREEVTLDIRFAGKVDLDRSSEPWDAWNLGNDPSKEGILEKCFPGPGAYQIVVSVDRYMEFIALKGGGREEQVGAWRGKLSSNGVKVKVTGKSS